MAVPTETPVGLARAKREADERFDSRYTATRHSVLERTGIAMLFLGFAAGTATAMVPPYGAALGLGTVALAALTFLLLTRRNQKVTA